MSRWDSRLDALERSIRIPPRSADLTPEVEAIAAEYGGERGPYGRLEAVTWRDGECTPVEYGPDGSIVVTPRIARKLLEHIGE